MFDWVLKTSVLQISRIIRIGVLYSPADSNITGKSFQHVPFPKNALFFDGNLFFLHPRYHPKVKGHILKYFQIK